MTKENAILDLQGRGAEVDEEGTLTLETVTPADDRKLVERIYGVHSPIWYVKRSYDLSWSDSVDVIDTLRRAR